MSNVFSISVPEDELQPRGFTPIPTGQYLSTFVGGAQIVGNNDGWKALELPFQGFTTEHGTIGATVSARFTVESASQQAVDIGARGVIGAAAAFGIAKISEGADGKKSYALTAVSSDELVEQFNAVAGSRALVYIKTSPRIRKSPDGIKHVQLRDGTTVPASTYQAERDGQAWIDSEIRSVQPAPDGTAVPF